MPHRLYRIIDLQSRKVLNVRHVSFHETKFPKHEWNKHVSEAKLDTIENEFDPIYVMEQNASEGNQDESGNAMGTGTVATRGQNDETHALDDRDLMLTHIPETISDDDDIVELWSENQNTVENDSGNSRDPRRERNTSDRFVFHSKISNEEQTIDQALSGPDASDWRDAIDAEVKAHEDNKTWKAQLPPPDTHVIDSKLILTIKKDPILDADARFFKARIVAKGYQQRQVENTYSPVIDVTSLRLLLNLITAMDGHLHEMDVKMAFLKGKLDESEIIYMRPPKSIEVGLKRRMLEAFKGDLWSENASKLWNRR